MENKFGFTKVKIFKSKSRMVIRTEEIISKLNRSQYNKKIGVKRAPTKVLLGLDDYIAELKIKIERYKKILNQKQ